MNQETMIKPIIALIIIAGLIVSSATQAEQKYLGDLSSNRYEANSTNNPYGRYGSKYSADSINNPYGRYGSKYSNESVNNPYATQAPKIYRNNHGGVSIYEQRR